MGGTHRRAREIEPPRPKLCSSDFTTTVSFTDDDDETVAIASTHNSPQCSRQAELDLHTLNLAYNSLVSIPSQTTEHPFDQTLASRYFAYVEPKPQIRYRIIRLSKLKVFTSANWQSSMGNESATENIRADADHTLPKFDLDIPLEPNKNDKAGVTVKIAMKTARSEGENVVAKIYRARHPLLIVFLTISYLVFKLLWINAGATGVRGILLPSYWRFEDQIYDSTARQLLLQYKRDILQHTRLQSRLFEGHFQCLTRAASVAHDHYDTLPYQYVEDILMETVEWAQDECDRIIFSPSPVQVPRNVLLKIWDSVYHSAGTAYYYCKGALKNLGKTNTRCSPKAEPKLELDSHSLPDGYLIECNDDMSRCRLLSFDVPLFLASGAHHEPTSKLVEEKAAVGRQLHEWKKVNNLVERIQPLIKWIFLLDMVAAFVAIG